MGYFKCTYFSKGNEDVTKLGTTFVLIYEMKNVGKFFNGLRHKNVSF